MIVSGLHTHVSSDEHGQFCRPPPPIPGGRLAVVATLSKGYDLDYIWNQVDRAPAKDAASYYIQASESGGEPPGRWWGPGAKALGFKSRPAGRARAVRAAVRRSARPLTAASSAGLRDGGRKAADLYAQLLAAEPHAAAERKRELRTEAVRQGPAKPPCSRPDDIAVQVDLDLPRLPRGKRAPGPPRRRHRRRPVLVRPGRRGRRHDLAGRERRF